MSLGVLRRSLCALGLTCCLVLPAMAAGGYSDVPEGAWYASAVEEMAEQGVLTGVTDTLFCPTAPVTRATVVTTLWRLEGCPEPQSSAGFSDVPGGQWYTQAVDWAAQEDIAAGDGKGAFQPNALVTREQLAIFFYQYDLYRGKETAQGVLDQFSDASAIHSWAKEGMEHAVGAGLIQGTGSKLEPLGTASRAQLAVLLQRLNTQVMG